MCLSHAHKFVWNHYRPQNKFYKILLVQFDSISFYCSRLNLFYISSGIQIHKSLNQHVWHLHLAFPFKETISHPFPQLSFLDLTALITHCTIPTEEQLPSFPQLLFAKHSPHKLAQLWLYIMPKKVLHKLLRQTT